jgi:3D (Asp-Asp-Asp) domain-containing protein
MKRLVYNPSINAWIKTDDGVFDLSPYITSCMVDRRINSVSYAEIEFRNPKIQDSNFKNKMRFMFTQHELIDNDGGLHYGPMFHPMDPIIITMTRLRGRPVQVFTGYCDTTPYVQLYPGVARLTASCTLKRLQYTYWDPALPFVRDFMQKTGWNITKDGTAFNAAPENTGNLNDASIGYLLYKILEDVGGWNKNDVYIQEMPGAKISQLVANLYKDTKEEQASSIKDFHKFLYDILGASKYGTAAAGPATASNGSTPGSNDATPPDWFKNNEGDIFEATIYGPDPSVGTINTPMEGGTGLAFSRQKLHAGIVDPMKGPYVIAADKNVIPKNTHVYIWPNPFNYDGTFEMADTGGAFIGTGDKHIDIYNSAGSAIASNTPHGGWNGVGGLRNNADGPFGGKYVRVKRA